MCIRDSINTGDKKPQIGQTAKVRHIGKKTPAIVITGIRPGTFSISGSIPFSGKINVMYNMIAKFTPRQISVRFMNSELISSFSQSCRKKFVLYTTNAETPTQKIA